MTSHVVTHTHRVPRRAVSHDAHLVDFCAITIAVRFAFIPAADEHAHEAASAPAAGRRRGGARLRCPRSASLARVSS
jgi:hypothetical protein